MSAGKSASVHLVAAGAQAPVGLEPRAIAAAVRAGLSRFEKSDRLRRRRDGEPMLVSLLSTMDPRWTASERMLRLAVEAASQALAPLGQGAIRSVQAPLPMVFSVPALRPGMVKGAGAKLARDVMAALPVPPDERLSGVFDSGGEGGLAALACAAGLLADGKAEACLVGGFDSLGDVDLLDWLDGLGRLKGEGAPSGLVPGEGAAFLLVCGDGFRRRTGLASLGRLTPGLRATEPHPWYAGQPCLGEGLTEAVRSALEAGLPEGTRAGVTWSDLNGEPWRADEWAYAYLRTAAHHGEPLRLRHPADCLGDLGAATGTMLVALAALELAHPRTEAGSALVLAASDTRPYRSACVVQCQKEAAT